MLCEYFDCKRKATRKIKTTLDKKPYVLKVCKKCYEEYKKVE